MNRISRTAIHAVLTLTIFLGACSAHTAITPQPQDAEQQAKQYAEAILHAHDVLDWHNCTWLHDGRNTVMSDCDNPPYGAELLQLIAAYELSHNASLTPWDVERAADGAATRVYYTWFYRRHTLCPDGICSDR